MRMLERQRDTAGKSPLRFLGVIFIIAGIFFSFQAFGIYKEQLAQSSWHETEATVKDVSSRTENRGGVRRRSHVTVYDVVYSYENDSGEGYVGKITGTLREKSVGDKITVKYDPENPSESTDILEPGFGAFLVNLFFGLFWMAVGIFPFIKSKLRFKNKKENQNKKEKQTVYSTKDISERGYPVKLCLWAVADGAKIHRFGVPLAVGACFVIFGILAENFIIFYAAGALALTFYIINGVVKPILEINKHYTRLGKYRFYKTVDGALSERKQGISPMTAVIIYLEDEVQ